MLLPRFEPPKGLQVLQGELKAIRDGQPAAYQTASKQVLKYRQRHNMGDLPPPVRGKPSATDAAASYIRLGFVAPWDLNSVDSLRRNAKLMTHVCTEWMTMGDLYGNIRVDAEDELVQPVLRRTRENNVRLLLMLNNLDGDNWEPERVESMLRGPRDRRDRMMNQVLAQLSKAGAAGLLIDWQEVDPVLRDELVGLITQFSGALHAAGFELWLTVPVGRDLEVFDVKAMAPYVDRFVASLHDENSDRDTPGPIASQTWLEAWVDTLLQSSGNEPSQWVITLGNYAYDWEDDEFPARTMSFADAAASASRADTRDVSFVPGALNPMFTYDDRGQHHTVWFLDAITFLNQARTVLESKAGGIGLYRLGQEDPQVWLSFPLITKRDLTPTDLQPLFTIRPGDQVAQIGEGEFITTDLTQRDGKRQVQVSGDYLTAKYETFPIFPSILHRGPSGGKKVSLTFDDGPDPTYTPQILEILRHYNVKATFFLLGSAAERYPELVAQIFQEGHLIGNHTYTHANMSEISEQQVNIELNATQRLIQAITGHSTILFRPPYIADSRPRDLSEARPIDLANKLGYTTVAQEIDPRDYEKPGADEMVRRVIQQRPHGNILLMHDGGGDRTQTVAALPRIIDHFLNRGDVIVPLNELAGVSYDAFMPPAQLEGRPYSQFFSASGFRVMVLAERALWSFLIVSTGLVVLRTLVITLLAVQSRKLPDGSIAVRGAKPQPEPSEPFLPGVSIVVAAYNESKVIGKTIRSLLDSDYAGPLQILVVDDGSSDDTAGAVERDFAGEDRVRVLRQTNSGKSQALTNGIAKADHDILVLLDADTLFETTTVSRLVAPFQDATVGAISGHARVGNDQRLIGKFQSLEYICGFNLDRRAYAALDCITVVPGAVGAWRRQAVEQAGGFNHDTLAEDTDITLMLHRNGWRVAYVPDAFAHTEAPDTVATLAKQRFRWAFGTMQCLWKHRDLVGNPQAGALGLFSLPSLWFFQIALIAASPIVDFLLILSLVSGRSPDLYLYGVLSVAADVMLALVACCTEKEPIRKSLLIIPMRFLYRPLLSWVIWKSLLAIGRGALVGWGKLERTGTVNVPVSSEPALK